MVKTESPTEAGDSRPATEGTGGVEGNIAELSGLAASLIRSWLWLTLCVHKSHGNGLFRQKGQRRQYCLGFEYADRQNINTS